jgi:hypothetical protein
MTSVFVPASTPGRHPGEAFGLGARFELRNDFETAVMQALIDDAPARSTRERSAPRNSPAAAGTAAH